MLANIEGGLKRPANGECTIGNDLQYEQNDGILSEDEVKRKAKPQKLQLFRVLAQRYGFLMDDVETTLAEGMLG